MMLSRSIALASRLRSFVHGDKDAFLRQVTGVIHVGANAGQERHLYDWFGLEVLWIEPIPEVFEELRTNLRGFPRQQALQYLVADRDDAEFEFHVASNQGQSSSILELHHHKDIWPEITYENTLRLRSKTLTTVVGGENVDLTRFQALVLDTQGAELLVLKGAAPLLRQFRYIKAEAADFESYVDGCRVADITSFLAPYGFKEFSRHKFATRRQGGSYYDVVYRKDQV